MSNLERDLKSFADLMSKAAQRADATWGASEEYRATLDKGVRQKIFDSMLAAAILPAVALCISAHAGKRSPKSFYSAAEAKALARDLAELFGNTLQTVEALCEKEKRRPAPVPGRTTVRALTHDHTGRVTSFEKIPG
jgi:hypothetical protein